MSSSSMFITSSSVHLPETGEGQQDVVVIHHRGFHCPRIQQSGETERHESHEIIKEFLQHIMEYLLDSVCVRVWKDGFSTAAWGIPSIRFLSYPRTSQSLSVAAAILSASLYKVFFCSGVSNAMRSPSIPIRGCIIIHRYACALFRRFQFAIVDVLHAGHGVLQQTAVGTQGQVLHGFFHRKI